MQSVNGSDFSGFFTPLPPLCFSLQGNLEIPPGKKTRPYTPLSSLPYANFTAVWGLYVSHWHTHCLQTSCHKVRVKRKTEMSWKGMPGKISLIDLAAEGRFMAPLVLAEHSLKDNSPPDLTAVPSACFSLGCTVLSQRSYKGFPRYWSHKHNLDCTIKVLISN